jgi:hypothetical protein
MAAVATLRWTGGFCPAVTAPLTPVNCLPAEHLAALTAKIGQAIRADMMLNVAPVIDDAQAFCCLWAVKLPVQTLQIVASPATKIASIKPLNYHFLCLLKNRLPKNACGSP